MRTPFALSIPPQCAHGSDDIGRQGHRGPPSVEATAGGQVAEPNLYLPLFMQAAETVAAGSQI